MTNDAPARTGRIRSATIDRRCPDLSISSGLAAYRYRAGRGWQQGANARSERSKHPRYFIFLGTLLEQMTPTPLVKTALQRLVPSNRKKRKSRHGCQRAAAGATLAQSLRGACLLNAGGTQGNQRSISHKSEGRQGHGPRIARDWPDSRRRAAGDRNRRRTTPNADADPARRFSEGLLLRQIDAFLLRR